MAHTTTAKARQARDQQEALEWLQTNIKPGDCIYTVYQHISASGADRSITLVVAYDSTTEVRLPTGETTTHTDSTGYTTTTPVYRWQTKIPTHRIMSITGYVANLMDYKRDAKHGGIKVQFTDGSDIVANLAAKLFGNPNALYNDHL